MADRHDFDAERRHHREPGFENERASFQDRDFGEERLPRGTYGMDSYDSQSYDRQNYSCQFGNSNREGSGQTGVDDDRPGKVDASTYPKQERIRWRFSAGGYWGYGSDYGGGLCSYGQFGQTGTQNTGQREPKS